MRKITIKNSRNLKLISRFLDLTYRFDGTFQAGNEKYDGHKGGSPPNLVFYFPNIEQNKGE